MPIPNQCIDCGKEIPAKVNFCKRCLEADREVESSVKEGIDNDEELNILNQYL